VRTERGRLRRGLAAVAAWRVLAVAAVVAALAAGAVVFAGGSGGASGPEPSTQATATGTVARRTLAERLTATGTIGFAGESTSLGRHSGTVTALPAVGAVIRRGETLYAIDGEPVPLLYGAVPTYRTLSAGVADGKDVEQLKRNLRALGYEPGTVDEEFTHATTAALLAWQEHLGVDATGEVELGRVAFLPGPRRVTRLEATLGEALKAARSSPVLDTSSTRRVVAVELEADQQSIAHRGEEVAILLSGGTEVAGNVTGLAAVAATSGAGPPGEEEEQPKVEATVSLTGRHRTAAPAGATVSVRFTQQVREHVLSVPLTALIAIGSERFAVHVVEGGARRQIVVTPGLAADGYVEVEGDGLEVGMRVETGE
jgi:peptidoglycan hydrolase-like protein with peptidoglycan-binding domain